MLCERADLRSKSITAALIVFALAALIVPAAAQNADVPTWALLVPDAVWDGVQEAPQRGFVVLIKGRQIEAVGRAEQVKAPPDTERIELPGTTLIPGLIEGHSHLFLHPYSEALWDDQVLKEPLAFRMAQAVA